MRRGLGRRSGAVGALLFAFVVIAPAAPAGADPVITIDKPAAGTVEVAAVAVSGSVASDTPLLNAVRRVTLTLKDRAPFTVDCAAQPCVFKWTPNLALNGPYELAVAATEATRLLGIEGASASATRKFAVAAPAAKPVLDTPKVTDGRNVELSWSRNTEPDMIYYAVFRKDPGSSKLFQVGRVDQAKTSGSKVAFTDTTTSGFSGGDYTYQVVAVRNGASGTASTEALSTPSAAGAAAVPPPPTITAVSAPPGTPGGPTAGGPTTTAKPAPPAGVDLSGFLSARSQPIALPPITVPEPPDTGFQGTLPFGARPPGADLEEGDAEAQVPGGRSGTNSSIVSLDGARPLVPVAGGLVLLLLAVHMRLLGRRVKAPADGDLPVELAPVAPTPRPQPPAPAPAPAPAVAILADPEPAPALETETEPDAHLYDVAADQDWSPHAADPDPEPEPEPATLWAPPEPDPEPEPAAFDPDEIEVFEVVSSTRRPLVRAGGH